MKLKVKCCKSFYSRSTVVEYKSKIIRTVTAWILLGRTVYGYHQRAAAATVRLIIEMSPLQRRFYNVQQVSETLQTHTANP